MDVMMIRLFRIVQKKYIFYLCVSLSVCLIGTTLRINTKKEYVPRCNVEVLSKFTKRTDFLVESEVCKIPRVNPFDQSIKDFVPYDPQISSCNDNNLLTYVDNNILYINFTNYRNQVEYCSYEPILYISNSFKLGKISGNFNKSVLVTDEFIKVQCFDSLNKVIAKNFHTVFVKKNLNQKAAHARKHVIQGENIPNTGNHRESRLNVLLIMLESTSRINSVRYLRKTRKYLLETLDATELLGYNKVALNTRPNMAALLTGDFLENLSCFKDSEGVDKCPFIWKEFSKFGYTTHYGQDAECTFYSKDMSGFKYQPTDYYDQPYHDANEQGKRELYKFCYNGKSSSEDVNERMFNLVSNLRDNPFFSLSMHIRMTHESLTRAVTIDKLISRTLQRLHKNSILNNTFLALFGDHGIRSGRVRPTFIGQLEERLPMMFMYVPPWFKTKYCSYFKNLRTNARRLTTHFDTHSTLLHLLDLDNNQHVMKTYRHKGISLFNEIPSNRSCQDANISSKWCACNLLKKNKKR
ncbi:unnamed protein product [Mytilus coruscus]|uniref:Sulfatase N-terminal domain-containing protein n=1 Tax=Mytilus coruscus TaxID=42192 RepID=A0A6J8CD12_MYTCO|nr:unnamed protein product [Mytilus coruscus]